METSASVSESSYGIAGYRKCKWWCNRTPDCLHAQMMPAATAEPILAIRTGRLRLGQEIAW
jgi:hypothetical protein